MASMRSSGSLALLSSSKISKYLSVKVTAEVASSGAPLLLCPGITTAGFNSRIVFSELNRRLRDLFGLADAPDGDGRHNPRNNIRRLLTLQRSIGQTRAQYIGADTTIFEFDVGP